MSELQCFHATHRQPLKHQHQNLKVGLDSGLTIQLGTDLDRFTRAMKAIRLGVQHAAGVTQPIHRIGRQQVRIDARHLRRDVGAHAHQPPGQLVNQLEGLEVEVRPTPVNSESTYSISGGITSW